MNDMNCEIEYELDHVHVWSNNKSNMTDKATNVLVLQNLNGASHTGVLGYLMLQEDTLVMSYIF